jgi:2'-hydroxyisoflavone reductase
MRVLILGGTAFVGVHLTRELRNRGHEVTHFNRGRTGESPPGVRVLRGDRTIGFVELDGERFDAVIDTSGYLPEDVERSARFFSRRTDRYVFVSSVSVFDHTVTEIFEDSPKPPLPEGMSQTLVTGESYGPLKAMCERIVTDTFGERATIVRPGLIVGPNDGTDRFTYWPLRFARGGEVLAPGTPDRPVQFIDVRDLGAFVALALEQELAGDYNIVTPPGAITMGDLMTVCAAVAQVPSNVQWVEDAFLVAHEVAPWSDLPLWIPPSSNIPGFMNHTVSKAFAAGLTVRPLAQTVRDTLQWATTRGVGYVPKTGITAHREMELLSQK